MSRWFWFLFIYSLCGCGLEKVFALAVHTPQRKRKCFLLLPLCPVYGLAMCLLLALAPIGGNFWVLSVLGGIICTVVEYAVHWFYDTIFGVQFWDYSGLPGHIAGRICPQFAVAWGLLSAWAVQYVHPAVEALAAAVSPSVTFLLWEIMVVDSVCTGALLLRYHDTAVLSLGVVWAAASHTNTS